MQIKLVNEKGELINEPHQIRIYGWSEEQYFKKAPRDRKCEFVKGELILMTPISYGHSETIQFVGSLLGMYCHAKNLGKALPGPTIRFAPEINREPDICFFQKEKARLVTGIPVTIIPSFIIEVSFTTSSTDLGEKAREYEKAGVEEYWVIDIDHNETFVHLRGKDGKYKVEKKIEERIDSKVIEGFYIEGKWLWQKPMPNSFECLNELLGM